LGNDGWSVEKTLPDKVQKLGPHESVVILALSTLCVKYVIARIFCFVSVS
jgi:hypothetical protein